MHVLAFLTPVARHDHGLSAQRPPDKRWDDRPALPGFLSLAVDVAWPHNGHVYVVPRYVGPSCSFREKDRRCQKSFSIDEHC